jgi:hypothetical protein
MDDGLYEKMLSLCPTDWKFIRILDSSAVGYLDYIFNTKFDTKWVLNLDEDCFLINHEAVNRMIEYMEKNDYDYSGIQDGGTIRVRIHNPLVSNPFFNLFNVEKIYPLKKDYYEKKYNVEEIRQKYSGFIKFNKTKIEWDLYERFYYHFFWLLDNGMKPLFLDADEFNAEKYFVIAPILRIKPYYNSPTILFSHEGEELALHTWHSRYYYYPNIKKRINNCYKYALDRSSLHKKNVETIKLGK